MTSLPSKVSKAQREELEIRRLSPDYMAVNDWGRMRLFNLEADQDMEAMIVMGKHGMVATVGSSSRR